MYNDYILHPVTVDPYSIMIPRHIKLRCLISLQVNEKSFDSKEGWYKKEGDKTGMDGWMDVAMVKT